MKKTMTPREGKKIRANSKKIKTEQKSKTNKNETKIYLRTSNPNLT